MRARAAASHPLARIAGEGGRRHRAALYMVFLFSGCLWRLDPLCGPGPYPGIMFAPDYPCETKSQIAPFDRTVAVAWAVSEVALDVFAMLFWSAIGLFAARALL